MLVAVAMAGVAAVPMVTSARTINRLPPELCAIEERSDLGMVATGSPEATRAAVDVLERGGNAIDAAVAAALVLGVVDFDASGIAGATNMLVHLASGRTLAVDGTSKAPLKIDIERFRRFKASGRTYGYEAIAVPTTLASLEYARERFGTMPMATLLEPAIQAAEHGYPLTDIQVMWTKKYYDNIMDSPPYVRYLTMEDGRTIGERGDRHCRPDLAATLRAIAEEGVRSFYFGNIAQRIEEDMIRGGGFLRRSDLATVRIREVQPLHTTYRGFDVYTFPPPGGGAGVVTALNLLETYPSEFLAADSVERLHVMIESFRIAAADSRVAANLRNHFGPHPLSKRYARERVKLITPARMIPAESLATPIPPECDQPGESTTQVSVADQWGNIVSLTQTLSRSFGAKIATPGLGFPYNSFLENYNADKPQCPGYLQPNSPCTTDMAPTIVLHDGVLVAALGTPGSNRISTVVSAVISNVVDRGMGIRDAVCAPRVLWGGMSRRRAFVEVAGRVSEQDVDDLEQIGYEAMTVLRFPPPDDDTMAKFGGVNAVGYDPQTLSFTGVGDPRRNGFALGPRVVAGQGVPH
ncbi:MAG: gamma-glutamyltransferase [Acidobacteria bacterium]|jgi:gamma-glutamyltranspeptidase/glutathione hydrolase|nr:gamma-glutamyltransferase [Acidobacteriota bacterium]